MAIARERGLVRDSQPQYAANVDWENPITRGLKDLSLLNSTQRRNAVRNSSLLSNGTVNSDPRGPIITTDATAYSIPGGHAVLPITVLVGFIRLGAPTSSEHALWISLDDATGNGGLYLRYNEAGSVALLKSQAVLINSTAFTIKPEGSLIGMTVDSGNFATYGDGRQLASGTHAQTFLSGVPVIGSESSNAAENHPNGIFYFHATWDRVLSADEIKSVSANIWQLIQPEDVDRWFSAAGGTTFTASLAGSLTASGVLSRLTSRTIAGMIQASSTAVKHSVQEIFNGSITPSGTLASQLVFVKAVAGSSTPSGSLSKSPLKSLSGTVTAAGSLVKLTTRTLVGSLTPLGSMLKSLSRTLLGSITATATYVSNYTTTKGTAGSLTPSSTVATSKFLTPVSTAGGIIKSLIRFIGK